MDKKPYTKPEITTVTFTVEKGYSFSTPLIQLSFLDEDMNGTTQASESFMTHDTWTNENGHFWD